MTKQEYAKYERDEMLRKEIHKIQTEVYSDIASIKLMTKHGNSVLINTGEDGTFQYAVVDNLEKVPSYYDILNIVLDGEYKIMEFDCAKSYDDKGEEIKGDYITVYRAGHSFIFVCEIL